MKEKEIATEALQLAKDIEPLLKGRGPLVQGACLADLVATYFRGVRPDMREETIEHWTMMMRELVRAEDSPWNESRSQRFGDEPISEWLKPPKSSRQ